jgi:hypothetical protein
MLLRPEFLNNNSETVEFSLNCSTGVIASYAFPSALGGGVKVYLTRHLGLKIQAEWLAKSQPRFLRPELSARFRWSATQGRYWELGKAVPHSSVNCTPRLSRTRVRD